MEFLKRLFSANGFMPHGHCYFWNPSLLRLHVISDALITLAYFTIPLTLIYIVHKRKDIPFDWIFACFGVFIVACGLTHAMEIWNIWYATYWLSGTIKAITAAASLATAVLLIRLIPKFMAIPSPEKLRLANRAMEAEITVRKQVEEAHQKLAADLARERQRLDEILNTVPAMVFEAHFPADGPPRMSFVSHYAERMFDFPPAEWLAAPQFWLERIHPDDREWVLDDVRQMSSGSRPRDLAFRWLARNGSVIWGESHFVQLHDPEGRIVGLRGFTFDVTERMQADSEMKRLNRELLEVSRRAGMAEVANSVLHNVGNVLNSVNVSCSVISATVRKSRLHSIDKAAKLLQDHKDDFATFFATDPAGQRLPDFLGKLGEKLAAEQVTVLRELEQLNRDIEHIKDVVIMQQNYGRLSGIPETVNVIDLVEDSLRMNVGALTRHDVQPIRDYGDVPLISAEKHKILQILVNLIRNAKYACDESPRMDKQIKIRVAGVDQGVRIDVSDNGVGIPAENLGRIFSHGFSTRKDGHGFGLHSSVLAAEQLGGYLTVHSDGPGAGATFTLELPLKPKPDN